MIATRVGATSEYTLKRERNIDGNPTADATIFRLRIMSAGQRARVRDSEMSVQATDGEDVEVEIQTASRDLTAVRFGVDGWSQMVDTDGSFVEPKLRGKGSADQALQEESVNLLPQYAIDELSAEVRRINGLTETERGNSGSSPKSPLRESGETATDSGSKTSAPSAKEDRQTVAKTRAPSAAVAAS